MLRFILISIWLGLFFVGCKSNDKTHFRVAMRSMSFDMYIHKNKRGTRPHLVERYSVKKNRILGKTLPRIELKEIQKSELDPVDTMRIEVYDKPYIGSRLMLVKIKTKDFFNPAYKIKNVHMRRWR